MKILGIDLGGTTAKCAYFVDDKMIHKFSIPTDRIHAIKHLKDEVEKELLNVNVKINDVEVLGVAIPGLVDMEEGIVNYSATFGWNNYPFAEEAKKAFNIKEVIILNDAKAATYGEWRVGYKSEINSMLLMTLGTGIGGGLIVHNQLIFGDLTKLPSEPGHGGGFQNDVECPCGCLGCIEPVSSATGMERKLNEVAKTTSGELNKLYKEKGILTLKDIDHLLQKDNKDVISVLEYCSDPLAKVISVMMHTLDMKSVVLAGGATKLGDKFLEIIKRNVNKYLLMVFREKINIKLSDMQEWAGLYGIIEYAKDEKKNRK